MKRLNFVQGSPEWKAARRKFKTASEASIVAAMSKNVSRDELLHMKATGSEQEFSEWFEKNILDKGHAVEAAARPFSEKLIAKKFGLDEDDAMLFPVTCIDDTEAYLASCDGLTDDGLIGWECKQWNAEKAAAVNSGLIPDCDKWQVAQQLMVTGAKHWLYTVSDGTEEGSAHVWVTPDMFDFDFLVAIWKQFEADLKNYQAPEVKPQAVADEVTALPAITMTATGQVAVVDNFAVFEAGLTAFLHNQLIREPKTDNDFATLDKQIKALKSAEDALNAAGDSVLAQVQAVDTAMKRKDSLSALVRENRLMAEKLLKAEKERRRMEIMQAATASVEAYVFDLNDEVGIRIPMPSLGLAGAMKGKKTIASLQSAANDEAARAKIESRQMADNVKENVQILGSMCSAEIKGLLFPDLESLATKPANDFKAIAQGRVIQHEQQLREREEAARRQAEAEAQAKAEAEAQAKAEAETKATEQQPAPALADIPLTTGTAIKAKTQPRTLGDALTHFGMQKNLGDQDIQELLDIVAHYTNLNAKAA
ncbi:MAG: endonuclease [Thalassobium sp.]|nr:MAG: endonuclease [Thalassobium sp.]